MKRIGGHLYIVLLLLLLLGLEVVENPITAWMEEDLGNLSFLPKSSPKEESKAIKIEIQPVICTCSVP